MTIPWDEWSRGAHGFILVCATCCDRRHRGRRTTLRSGDIPVYKTEAGAGRHVDRFPRHRLEGVLELRRRYLERPETIFEAVLASQRDRSHIATVTAEPSRPPAATRPSS